MPRALQPRPVSCLLVVPQRSNGRGECLSHGVARKHMAMSTTTQVPKLRVVVDCGSYLLALVLSSAYRISARFAQQQPCTAPAEGRLYNGLCLTTDSNRPDRAVLSPINHFCGLVDMKCYLISGPLAKPRYTLFPLSETQTPHLLAAVLSTAGETSQQLYNRQV